jgi:hypothetical protein
LIRESAKLFFTSSIFNAEIPSILKKIEVADFAFTVLENELILVW